MQRQSYVRNAAILTATGLLLRAIGMFFRVYIAARIGAEGMGLYQLIYTVYTLAVTFATAGLSVAATRICAQLFAGGCPGKARRAMESVLSLGCGLGFLAGMLLYAAAPWAAQLQTLPVDGIIVVTSPQELVGLIVEKAVKMANMMNVPILGIVENMSYAVCPDCGKKLYVFGESHVQEIAARYHLPVLAQCPIDPELAKQADLGVIESFETDHLDKAADVVEALLKEK